MSRGPRAAGRRPARRMEAPLVGVVSRQGRFKVAEPLFDRGARVALEPDAREGDLVLVGGGKRGARVVRTLGSPDVARDVLEGLMLERGLRRAFPRAAEVEAREVAGDPYAADDRVDLRELPTFTIDPPDARDFDDAISARVEGDTVRLWVHIADVTAFVRPGGALEGEAYRRATSVYVPGAVEPMLPDELSSGACSLRPGEDRLALTVELEMRGTDAERVRFHRSVIRSNARLTYPQVDDVFAGRVRAEEPWAAPLEAARRVSRALRDRRDARGSLAVESSEPSFEFSSEGDVTGVHHEPQTESHRLIEELMILANEQVAGHLADARGPAIYRVHERPEPRAVAHMIDRLATLDVPTPPVPDEMSPQQAADLAAEASRLVAQHVKQTGRGRRAFGSMVLRSLKQAYYSTRNLGHAGLASARYTHFTSPIRRYPDVAVHRALLQDLGIDSTAAPASELDAAAEASSTAERGAMQIERAADDVCLAFLLRRRLAEADPADPPVHSGEVVGLISQGAFVAFGEEAFEGFLAVRRLSDWWELSEEETMLVADKSGRRLALGDAVDVVVDRVDAPRGRVDLLLPGGYS